MEIDYGVTLHLYLLGSPRLTWQNQPVNVARRQVRALLFRLATTLQPISRDELHGLLWPDKPDTIARRNLSRLLSYLRQDLPDSDLLHVTTESVTLNLARVWSDTTALLQVNVSQDPDDVLTTAVPSQLAPFLHGFTLPNNPDFEAWQRQTQHQLEQQTLACLAELVTRKTAVSDHQAAIQYAQHALALDDLAEETHRQLIHLYTHTGDRAAAQRQYEQCVTILERELGVTPLPETRAAYEAALLERNHQRQLPPIKPKWTTLPSLELPLIGRETDIQQLTQSTQRLQSGGIIFISGEPGIGKSRLMQTAAQANSEKLILAGAAHAGLQSVPYAPLLSMLRPITQQPELLAQLPTSWLSELLPLLPELRQTRPDLPSPLPPEPEQAQTIRFEALTQLLLTLAQHRPVWFCLDDVQWADSVTLAWLSFLLPHLSGSRILVLATLRTRHIHTLTDLRQQARRANLLAEISLSPLAVNDVKTVLTKLETAVPNPQALAQQLHTATGGNPFFLLETIRDLLEADQLQQQPNTLPLPDSVRSTINTRLSRLSPLTQQILEAAAVLETTLQLSLLTAVSGRKDDEVGEALNELVEHQILYSAGSNIQFQHDLTRVTIVEGLHIWRKQLLHRRAAAALSEQAQIDWAVVATHWHVAESWETAVDAYTNAAQQAAALYAYDTALTLVNLGLSLLNHLTEPQPFKLHLLTLRLQIHQALLNQTEWAEDLAQVEQFASALANESATLAALESRLSLLALQSNLPELETTATHALALAQQTRQKNATARIHHILGWHLADVGGRPADGLAHLETAVQLATELDDIQLRYRTLCDLAFCQRSLGRCQDARTSARTALNLLPTADEPYLAQADGLRELAEASGYLARWQESRAAMKQVVQLYETMRDPWALGASLYNLGLFTSAMGQHDEAITSFSRLVQLGVDVGLSPDSEFGLIHRTGLVKALLRSSDVASAADLFASLHLPDSISGRARFDYHTKAGELAMAQEDWKTAVTHLSHVVEQLQKQPIIHFAYAALLHALAAHHLSDINTALASLHLAESLLDQGDCIHSNRLRHFIRYQITHDPIALTAAHTELQRQTSLFTNAALRHDFLQNDQLNQGILASWQTLHP